MPSSHTITARIQSLDLSILKRQKSSRVCIAYSSGGRFHSAVFMEIKIENNKVTICYEAKTSAGGRPPQLLEVARDLRDMLDDLISSSREAPEMTKVLQSPAERLNNVLTSSQGLMSPQERDVERIARERENSPADRLNNVLAPSQSVRSPEERKVNRLVKEHEQPCGHWCSQHASMLNPAQWGTLPEELLQNSFARLPVPDICRLRSLSKLWDSNFKSKDSEFKRICADIHSKMFALIQPNQFDDMDRFQVLLYDVIFEKWYPYEIFWPHKDAYFTTVSAADGGLVCFVAIKNKTRQPLLILLCNPLTNHWKELPLPQHVSTTVQLKMVHLKTDRQRNCYKVFIVGKKKGGVLVAELFDSSTGTWSNTNLSSDLVYGYHYAFELGENDENYRHNFLLQNCRIGPCVYDNVKGELLALNDLKNPLRKLSVEAHTFVDDRLFVWHLERIPGENGHLKPEYNLSEFQRRSCSTNWIKVKDYSCCTSIKYPRGSNSRSWLYVCEGLLLLMVEEGDPWGDHRPHQVPWLLDLSTGVWQVLPGVPKMTYYPYYKGGPKPDRDLEGSVLMCVVQWNSP